MPGTWVSNSGPRSSLGSRPRPSKYATYLLVLQETHWQATAEFSVAGWYCISSASEYVPTVADKTLGGSAQPAPTVPAGALPNQPRPRRKSLRGSKDPSTTKADGVMVLLSPAVSGITVRWKEHLKGRLLETRFDWHGARTTVLAVYQHVWSPAKTVQANKQDRAAVLRALSRGVRRVPARDTMVIAGDFNSSVSPTPRLVGPRILAPQEARPDEAEFTNFVRAHHLTVLNTWQVSSPHTFVQRDSRTQIDFLLTKVSSSGGSAKQAAPLANFPLGSWKTGGHLPLFARIQPIRHWHLPGPRAKPGCANAPGPSQKQRLTSLCTPMFSLTLTAFCRRPRHFRLRKLLKRQPTTAISARQPLTQLTDCTCTQQRCTETPSSASSRPPLIENFMLRTVCRSVLHATSPSSSGRVCVTTFCRGPARRRTLCVTSPPRGLCPAPVQKYFSCKSSDERCRARPDRN